MEALDVLSPAATELIDDDLLSVGNQFLPLKPFALTLSDIVSSSHLRLTCVSPASHLRLTCVSTLQQARMIWL